MSRTIPVPVQTKLDNGVSTFAVCWKLTRTDGTVMRFTNFHDDLIVDGQTYLAKTAIVPSTLKQTGTTSIDNLTVSGIISSDEISISDILASRYDYAEIEFGLVDYLDVDSGLFAKVIGDFGEIQASGNSFETELRLLIQRYTRKIIEVTSKDCRVMKFCDERCGLNLATYTFTGEVDSVTSSRVFSCTGTGIVGKPDKYFARGSVKWLTGNNTGIVCDVKKFENSGTVVTLQINTPFEIESGDEFDIVAGCDRRFETCRDKYSNTINFHGEPHVPGDDYMVGASIKT